MIIFIGSQFFFIKVFINFILNSITFVAIIIFGVLLIKSVKKEILQREEFVKLNIDLKKLIKQRQDLVHLVTHKVKGYFTRSKCVFAEMIEGSFGALPPKAKEMAMLGLDSDNEGINTIDIVLNAASLQAGLIKYDIKPIDFRKVVEQAIESKKDQAKIKGLKLETEIKDGNYILTGDKLWLKEVALNLVDNAVKYTNTGEITVGLELKEKQILFYVKDTGDGITDEDRKNLWTEGGRGKRSLLKNPNSTGYGLYLVKLIIEAHKGKVWEESAVGKGSIFYVKLPLNIKRLSDN
ncbi:HAMP domain-containing histidine kinase [Patescibacteria group bacterium]|nr:HAMP domain-containing histidine kinase [Patescibacteria group bacterium]MBU1663626.1 HAMP domain-containing histidine kinase [Patescibacteria group bacterium]MBU1933882.1 HAMP domain-containing histidine kinase [Patescibacteria group bacterium]